MTSALSSIFKAYDIRGLSPSELDPPLARRIGIAFVDYLKAKNIVIGRDMRDTSPQLAAAFIEGARSRGANVVDIGMVSTDMLYYAVASQAKDGGAMLTASHNPKQYNGIKLVRSGAIALSGDAGIKEVRDGALGPEPAALAGPPGALTEQDVSAAYVAHCLSFIDVKKMRPLKLVLDAGNGMGGPTAERIFGGLPFERTDLYFAPDGNFPNHPADPLVEENRRDIIVMVKAKGADMGIAWDGDADRCFFIDDTGEFIPGDFVTALLGTMFAKREPGATIVYDCRASRAVADSVKGAGGVPVMHRVGHAFMKVKMRELNAVYGGEVSAHYYFRDNWFADNGMIPALLLLELVCGSGRKLSELLAPYRAKYFISGEINSKVADVPRALARIEERYRDGRILKLDGISVDYDSWHFNVRGSNTEPLLRLNLEAYSQAEMEQRRDEVLELIRG
ncbi:MAG: phosphomannomutase/phosphoglucomutase [Vicinamibacteria bacterium]|nr:phosphomannomutase/phosphoglucomutase [Vicinamibacteria bacterium]